jgi:hypothetical protein
LRLRGMVAQALEKGSAQVVEEKDGEDQSEVGDREVGDREVVENDKDGK